MMKKKIVCPICEKHENPYKNHEEFEGTIENPENFVLTNSRLDEVEMVHEECIENYYDN